MIDQPVSRDAPAWLRNGRLITNPETFTPRELDLKGERTAWALAVGLLALMIFLRWGMQIWSTALLTIFMLCTLAASLITFGAWMERNTRIEVTSTGVRYKNPLRDRLIRWEELSRISIYPRGSGFRVLVESSMIQFGFQTSTIVGTGWGDPIETGVARGEQLVSGMVGMAKLTAISSDGEGWTCSNSQH
jgi:hypothetical protein